MVKKKASKCIKNPNDPVWPLHFISSKTVLEIGHDESLNRNICADMLHPNVLPKKQEAERRLKDEAQNLQKKMFPSRNWFN